MSLLNSLNDFVFGPIPTVAAAHPFPMELDRRTVMLVDDDTALLESVQCLLHEAGFNVLKSDRGVKGLEVFDFIPDDVRVILLDYQMPELDGERTLQLLRKINPHVKIVAFTGVAINELPPGYRNGVDRIVTKPFDSIELIEMLNELCRSAA